MFLSGSNLCCVCMSVVYYESTSKVLHYKVNIDEKHDVNANYILLYVIY